MRHTDDELAGAGFPPYSEGTGDPAEERREQQSDGGAVSVRGTLRRPAIASGARWKPVVIGEGRVSKGRWPGVGCDICDADAAFLRSTRPPYEALRPRIRVVDLFAGCGGLTLGAAEAARRLGLGIDVRLAVDVDQTATKVYQANLPGADVCCVRVEELFEGHAGGLPTEAESAVKGASESSTCSSAARRARGIPT